MAYPGLVPSEHSAGSSRRQGGIARTGNGHARRMLVESAWSYRFQARQTMHLERKAVAHCSGEVRIIARIENPDIMAKLLTHVDAESDTPTSRLPVSRAPPQLSCLLASNQIADEIGEAPVGRFFNLRLSHVPSFSSAINHLAVVQPSGSGKVTLKSGISLSRRF